MSETSEKEFGDLVYDVWRAGGDPDAVSRDRFEDQYEGRYDFLSDSGILRSELRRQGVSHDHEGY